MRRNRISAICWWKTRRSARFVKEKYQFAEIPHIIIERTRNEVVVHLYTARPGVIIGRKGQEVDRLKARVGRPDWSPDGTENCRSEQSQSERHLGR